MCDQDVGNQAVAALGDEPSNRPPKSKMNSEIVSLIKAVSFPIGLSLFIVAALAYLFNWIEKNEQP